jgi:hypothetical protein
VAEEQAHHHGRQRRDRELQRVAPRVRPAREHAEHEVEHPRAIEDQQREQRAHVHRDHEDQALLFHAEQRACDHQVPIARYGQELGDSLHDAEQHRFP